MILAIVGPTSVGKSEVAAACAQKIPAEIVAVDSMQVYRGMDRGTGKPDPSLRQKIPHHGLDLVDPEEEFNVAQYLRQVGPFIEEIQRRNRVPILVGGTGLYVKALLDGICPAPGENSTVRQRLLREGQAKGRSVLHSRLVEVDPQAAQKIHPHDLRRTVRALEVFEVTGRPMSQWRQETLSPLAEVESVQLFGLTCAREILYRKIEERINEWLAKGWLEEAKALHARRLSLTAKEALGYRQLYDFLDGKTDWATTVHLIKRNTRRYAKRQWAWFKRDPRIRWIDVEGREPQEVAGKILEKNLKGSDPSGAFRQGIVAREV